MKKTKKLFQAFKIGFAVVSSPIVLSAACVFTPSKKDYQDFYKEMEKYQSDLEKENTSKNGEYKYLIASFRSYMDNLRLINNQVHLSTKGDLSDTNYNNLLAGMHTVMYSAKQIKTAIDENIAERKTNLETNPIYDSELLIIPYFTVSSLGNTSGGYQSVLSALNSFRFNLEEQRKIETNKAKTEVFAAAEKIIDLYDDVTKNIMLRFYDTYQFDFNILTDTEYEQIFDEIYQKIELFDNLLSSNDSSESQQEKIDLLSTSNFTHLFEIKNLIKKASL
ncbi:hypothetical protein [Mycoplasma buteonis]|uniref:hypothetical protein n=1 Tax=Mycoplasma buteonis TaxID=171280 RepID=UPI00056290C1|nr:hypothetical protein [Mycoplasma buteonis]